MSSRFTAVTATPVKFWRVPGVAMRCAVSCASVTSSLAMSTGLTCPSAVPP